LPCGVEWRFNCIAIDVRRFAEIAESIAATRSRLAKIQILSSYLASLPSADLRAAAIFFTGHPFPAFDARTLNLGGSLLVRAIQQISGADSAAIANAYMEFADLGAVAEKLLPIPSCSDISPQQVFSVFESIVVLSGNSPKLAAITDLLSKLAPREAKYVIKIITGDMRIGLKESTVEEAIAKAFERPPDAVRRTNMALGDIGETAIIARKGEFGETTARLFRPMKFMLATAAENEDEIFSNFTGPFFVEDKYDGIRAQLHVEPPRAAVYSRTLDDVSNQFPEIVEAGEELARTMNQSIVADGELVAYANGGVLPFALLQKRLGRKKPSDRLLAEVPVRLMIFDLLYYDGRVVIDLPLSERKSILNRIQWPDRLAVAPYFLLTHRVSLESFFEESALRRNEGLMLKDAASFYAPGKRGISWMKWKKTLATLDVVVTGVELGHGRRRDVLSDYTFAVRNDGRLLNIGKAYSGLTDAEILEMTTFFKSHTIEERGRFRVVEPIVVLEVAFNGIQKSTRHNSGFALRFPRIVRIRHDKKPEDIDTVDAVEKIYARHVGES
jgi:ATP-dependent DNA ligase